MFEVGDRVGLLNMSGTMKFAAQTHQVMGVESWKGEVAYVLICPVDKLDQVRPGQTTVPVTKIPPDRIYKGEGRRTLAEAMDEGGIEGGEDRSDDEIYGG